MTREEMIQAAQAKFERESLIKAAQEKWARENMPEKPAPAPSMFPEKIETAARSALEGASYGFSEDAISGANAVIGNLIDAGFDSESLKDFFSKSVDTARIQSEFKRDVERRKKLEAEFPEVAIPSEIAGALAIGKGATQLPGALGAVAKGLGAPARAIEALGEISAGMLPAEIAGSQKIAQAIKDIAKGAVTSAGAVGFKEAVQVPTGIATPKEFDLKEAAALGAAVPGAFQAAGYLKGQLPSFGKKLISTLGGVSEKGIENYLKDPQAFLKAKSPEEIKDILDNVVSELQQGLDEAKVSAKEAQTILDKTKDALSQEVSERVSEFRQKKFDLTLLKKEAQEKLNDAISVSKKDTASLLDATKNSLRLDAVDAVENLKEQVINNSKKSYQILEDSGRVVSVKPAVTAAKEALDSLKIQNKRPTAGASAQAYSAIENYLTDLKRYKNILSAKDAKKKIQQLDQDWVSSLSKGEFTDSEQRAIRSIRAAFDSQLKDIPEYAEIMDLVSNQTDLLSRANKAFGNLEKSTARIARIDKPFKTEDRQLLIDLGNATRRPFEQKLSELSQIGTQMVPGVAEKQIMAGPAGRELGKLEQQLGKMKRPEAMDIVKQQVLSGPLASGVREAEQTLMRRQLLINQAQEKLKSIGPFGRPATNISAIRTSVTQRNPEYDRYLKNLTQLSDVDFKSLVDDLRTAEQFNKEFRIGSRNVNLWGLGTGAAMYGLTGDPTISLVLAGLGGGFGSLVDRFGPKMTKSILDSYLKISGMPTIQKINMAFKNFPPEIIETVKNDFAKSYSLATPEEVLVDQENAFQVVDDIKNSSLSSVEKVKMIQRINNNLPINSTELSAVILGKKVKTRPNIFVPKTETKILEEDKPAMLKALDRL